MTFLTIVMVFALVQYLGSAAVVQRDDGLYRWFAWGQQALGRGVAGWCLQVLGPVLLLWLAMYLLSGISAWLALLAAVPVLMWSLGRGDLNADLREYCDALQRQDNEAAAVRAEYLGAEIGDAAGWTGLNRAVLQSTVGRGLDRWFVVLFWFVLLGPAGALLYRVAALSAAAAGEDEQACVLSQRLCWLLEWPVVRLLAFTFALTGNFSSALHNWQQWIWDTQSPSAEVMVYTVLGALDLNSDPVSRENIGERELEAVLPLLRRSLLLWLCVLAVLSLVGW